MAWSDSDAVETIARSAERATALAIGPGLGRGDERGALVRELLQRLRLPAVVDADALFGLEPVERDAPTVLTPHAGELARLLDTDSEWVNAHRLAAAQQGADRYRAIVVLKGADTIVAAPGVGVIVCDLGPPTLATAGTGDVLTGVVGAFLARASSRSSPQPRPPSCTRRRPSSRPSAPGSSRAICSRPCRLPSREHERSSRL